MNDGGEESDRSEAATPFKLAEARKRGQASKSAELVAALVFTGATAWLCARGLSGLDALLQLDRLLLAQSAQAVAGESGAWRLWHLCEQALRAVFAMMLPAMAAAILVAVLANVCQTGPIWSLHPLKPDWQRISPSAGWRRVASLRTLFEAGRTCLKAAVFALVLYWTLRDFAPRLLRSFDIAPHGQAALLVGDLASMSLRLAAAALCIGAVDLVYARREFTGKMRMSRREIRDEFKHREGDPRIRSRMRAIRREMLRRSASVRRTKDADVLVTNPTHVAVALSYRHGEMSAPVLIGKGEGLLAAAMRAIAVRHRVPIVRSPALARSLHAQAALDRQIPVALYGDVARLMVWILSMKSNRRDAGEAA